MNIFDVALWVKLPVNLPFRNRTIPIKKTIIIIVFKIVENTRDDN